MRKRIEPIQVYGRFDGYWSHAQVSRGLVRGLHAHGVPLRIWNVAAGALNTVYEDIPSDVEVGLDSGARLGFYVGGYPPMGVSWLIEHPVKIGMFITESSVIPNSWYGMARACQVVVVPSHWAADAYRGVGVKRVLVVPHGLHPAYQVRAPASKESPYWRFLHVAGAADFLDRKGTMRLVEAFTKVFQDIPEAKLRLRLARDILLGDELPTGVEVQVTEAVAPEVFREVLVSYDAVVQPSRAEAFGLVPLEARALGIPVILTASSGHAEHAEAWDTLIPGRAEKPITVQGIPGGRAPDVTVADIVKALERFWSQREMLAERAREKARGYYERWSWEAVTKGLARKLVAIAELAAR